MREQGVKPVKSIDTEKHEFVKDEKGKYFHAECYGYYLLEKKKMSVEEADHKVAERLLITKKEIREQEEKDKFLRWIMDYYDGTLPSYFLKKLKAVREGIYEGLNEPIDYATLLDIYQRMANYLNKIAAKNKVIYARFLIQIHQPQHLPTMSPAENQTTDISIPLRPVIVFMSRWNRQPARHVSLGKTLKHSVVSPRPVAFNLAFSYY